MDTGQIIYSTLKGNGVPDPLASFVVAQAKHETDGFTSNVFNTCNNAFGYKATGSAPACSQAPEGGSYRYYRDVLESTNDLTGYLFRRVADGKFPPLNQITSSDQYATLLKNAGYYGDQESVYAAGLRKWFVDYSPLIGAGMILLAAVLYILYTSTKKTT